MEKPKLSANKRTVLGRKVKKLRQDGIVPANLYGKKIKSQAVQVAEKEFSSVFTKAGETGLVELMIDKVAHPVLIHNVQFHPVANSPIHIDFFQVDLKEKVTAKVPLHILGEVPAVKDKLGVLLHLISEVEVQALPADLPEKIEVDVSNLARVGDTLKIADLKVLDKVKIVSDSSLEVVKIAPLVSREAEQMAAETAAAAAAAATEAAATQPAPAEGVPPTEAKPTEAGVKPQPTATQPPPAPRA